jgi:hypothetical protein
VHAGIAIAVGHVNVAIGVADHLGRVVERSRCTFDQPILDRTRVGMLPLCAERQLDLAIEGE